MKIEDVHEKQKDGVEALKTTAALYPKNKEVKRQLEEGIIILNALEKQISAKVKNENLDEYYTGICPRCGKEITKLYKPLFCWCCGQALRWLD